MVLNTLGRGGTGGIATLARSGCSPAANAATRSFSLEWMLEISLPVLLLLRSLPLLIECRLDVFEVEVRLVEVEMEVESRETLVAGVPVVDPPELRLAGDTP